MINWNHCRTGSLIEIWMGLGLLLEETTEKEYYILWFEEI